jgi:hypothetical protein
MRLILIGCEYAGKQTLATELSRWMIDNMGLASVRWHNHFVVPHLNQHLVVPVEAAANTVEAEAFDEADLAQILSLRPAVLEQFQRHMIWRHFTADLFRNDADFLLIHWYYADAVYAPLYYGYGAPGTFSDRRRRARAWDMELLRLAPDTVLALVEAAPETIRERMARQPRARCPLREEDVETVIRRFAEEYGNSLIRNRVRVDTTGATPAESAQALVQALEPHWPPSNRQRMGRTEGGEGI